MSDYMSHLGKPEKFQLYVKNTIELVNKLKLQEQFDCIAVTGLSGASVGCAVSYATGIPIVYIRKPNVSTHGTPIEGFDCVENSKYIIIDDLICTGETIRRILIDMIGKGECIAIVLYNDYASGGYLFDGKYQVYSSKEQV